MKIWLGIDVLKPGDGIGVVAESMARYLCDRGHDIRVVCGQCDIPTSLPIIRCKYNDRLRQTDIFDVVRTIKEGQPDIFHSHYFPMDICGGLINSPRTKHVMHFHGVYYLSLRRTIKEIVAAPRAHVGEFLGAHLSSKIIAVSKFTQRELERKYLIQSARIESIYNGIDLDSFRPDLSGAEVREKYGIDRDQPVLICVATETPRKGHDLLLDCFGLVAQRVEKVRLLLVGVSARSKSTYIKKLIQKMHRLGIQQHVIFCGIVKEEMPKYYAASDIFVSATKWESFGLPFIEAMACGKPVIGFDRTAMSELIVDGYNGYKVEYQDVSAMANRVAELCNDPDLATRLGENGRTFAETNFDLETNMTKVMAIYDSLVRGNQF